MHRVPPAAPGCHLPPRKHSTTAGGNRLGNGEMRGGYWTYCWVCLDGQPPAEQGWERAEPLWASGLSEQRPHPVYSKAVLRAAECHCQSKTPPRVSARSALSRFVRALPLSHWGLSFPYYLKSGLEPVYLQRGCALKEQATGSAALICSRTCTSLWRGHSWRLMVR